MASSIASIVLPMVTVKAAVKSNLKTELQRGSDLAPTISSTLKMYFLVVRFATTARDSKVEMVAHHHGFHFRFAK